MLQRVDVTERLNRTASMMGARVPAVQGLRGLGDPGGEHRE